MSIELIRLLTLEVMRSGIEHEAELPDLAACIDLVEAAEVTPREPVGLPADLREQGLAARHDARSAGRELFEVASRKDAPIEWRMAYPGHEEADMRLFNDGYRFAWLAGSGPAPLSCPDIAVAISFQAAGIHYPSHVHRAPELYHVIAGEASWTWGGDQVTIRPPGDWLLHPSGTRHAMTTHDEALVAFAIWTAHPDSEAVIVRN